MTGEIVTDLFGGLRQLPSGGRGRPAHRWSQDKEDRVLLGLAMGYSDAEIASGLEISVPTLRKHYFSALKRRDMQRTRFELWRADVLARQANLGNVGAVKELGKIMERRDRHLADLRLQGRGEPEPKKGKKELRREAAERAADGAADGWGDLLNPSVH